MVPVTEETLSSPWTVTFSQIIFPLDILLLESKEALLMKTTFPALEVLVNVATGASLRLSSKPDKLLEQLGELSPLGARQP